MTTKVNTIIYPVTDIAAAKALYGRLLGVAPYADEVYYVGFRVDGQDIGLDPNGHKKGMTGPIGYFDVEDIHGVLKGLVESGAEVLQEPRDVGGGKLIATLKDADGNVFGLAQNPA
jgi:predicted enzyme related to lactoylglutathione lyase